jgi:hypothetical protein
VVWRDDDIRADYGLSAFNRTHVLVMSGTLNVWRTFNIATVVSALSGTRINETIGRDANGDGVSNNDRPIAGIDDLAFPIRSPLDSQGRAVINGLEGPGSLDMNLSFRYSVPLATGASSLDLSFDLFNVLNRMNLSNPTGNRNSSQFMVPTAAGFARQAQFGVRVRF